MPEISLGFFLVLDNPRTAGLLLRCQLPTLDTNYWSRVSFESFTEKDLVAIIVVLEIPLAIPASNEGKIEERNSTAQGLIMTHIRKRGDNNTIMYRYTGTVIEI